MSVVCIYHSECFDGFGAAWAVHWHFDHHRDESVYGTKVEYVPGVYGEPPPDVTGKDVILVDFSYKRPVLETMIEQSASLLVLDHHKTAEADLAFLPRHDRYRAQKASAVFDMQRSGARIAWDHFHDGPAPQLLLHVEDRDLWRFALPHTREIQAALSSYRYDFTVWDELMRRPIPELVAEGIALERKQQVDVEKLTAMTRRRMVIGGYDVPVANLPNTLCSDAGNLLAVGETFGACYWDDAKGRTFSLRSITDFDVSEIAKKYGGGGHPRAAGFPAPRGWEGDGA